MLDEATIWKRLTAVFEDVLDTDNVELTRETKASDVSGWDSVAHVQLIIAVEKTFGFRFRTAEISGLKHVGDLVDFIAARATR